MSFKQQFALHSTAPKASNYTTGNRVCQNLLQAQVNSTCDTLLPFLNLPHRGSTEYEPLYAIEPLMRKGK